MQSYHMPDSVDNRYQGDAIAFDIKVEAEQLGKSVLVLENKYASNTDLSHTIHDNTYAQLTYGVRDRTFSYKFDVYGMAVDGDYTLIHYDVPLDGVDNWSMRSNSLALINVNVSGGEAHVESEIELNKNLINAKLWLIPGAYTPGNTTGNFGWNWENILMETGLADYYDADIY